MIPHTISAMTNILTNPWILLLLGALLAVVVATLLQIRGDRPVSPPGSPRDWRDELLDWRLLRLGG